MNIDEIGVQWCSEISDGNSDGIWNAATGTCSLVQNYFATYTANCEGTKIYMTSDECNCDPDVCYSETEVECSTLGGEWIIETNTLKISITGDTLTFIDKDRWDGGFCDCEDSNDEN